MPYILNRQACAWILPASADDVHKAVIINPGTAKPVDAAHWDAVRKGNTVIDALLTGRFLTVHDSEPDTDVRLHTIDTAEPMASLVGEQDQLSEVVERKTKSTSSAEIDLGDEPTPAKGKRK